MDRIYLDFNCFQRQWDDQSQRRINLESRSCEVIFRGALAKKLHLFWSPVLQDEWLKIPSLVKRANTAFYIRCASESLKPVPEINDTASELINVYRLKQTDALHVAYAICYRMDYFLTCDDEVLDRLPPILYQVRIMNPMMYVAMDR